MFSGIIGLGEGLGKGTQVWKGVLGGVLGGLIGGLILELYQFSENENPNSYIENYSKMQVLAFILTFLGAMIGAAVASISSLLKGAEVIVQDGKLSGRVYDISKYVDSKHGKYRSGIIGSSEWESDIYLPGDPDIMPNHAKIHFSNGAPTLTISSNEGNKGKIYLNGHSINSSPLANGDRIKVGSVTLIYREKKKSSQKK